MSFNQHILEKGTFVRASCRRPQHQPRLGLRLHLDEGLCPLHHHLLQGAGTAGDDPTITVSQAKTVAGGSAKALGFTRVDKKQARPTSCRPAPSPRRPRLRPRATTRSTPPTAPGPTPTSPSRPRWSSSTSRSTRWTSTAASTASPHHDRLGDVGTNAQLGCAALLPARAALLAGHLCARQGLGDRRLSLAGRRDGAGVLFGDDVFVGPNVTVCNDRWPRVSKDGFDADAFRAATSRSW
jgi:hypothetical protein